MARAPVRTAGSSPSTPRSATEWDHALVDEGVALLDSVWLRPDPGPFRVQAAIAAVHAAPGDTDWLEVAGLYAVLEQLSPTGPVRLGRVVAVARALGPERGLQLLDEQPGLASDDLTAQRFHAVRAHLLDQVGRSARGGRALPDRSVAHGQRGRADLPARAGCVRGCRRRARPAAIPLSVVRCCGTSALDAREMTPSPAATDPGSTRRPHAGTAA